MPTTYTPRLLQTETAHKRADFELIIRDLEHVSKCCTLLLERGEYLVANFQSAALLDSIAIRYRRCFSGGVRYRLDPKALSCIQAGTFDLHSFFLGMADKHIAHSVNGFEKQASVFYLGIDDRDGTVRRGGLGSQGEFTVGLSLEMLWRFSSLVQNLIAEVKEKHLLLTEQVKKEVDAMSEAQLCALPEGFPPFEREIPVAVKRRWPRP